MTTFLQDFNQKNLHQTLLKALSAKNQNFLVTFFRKSRNPYQKPSRFAPENHFFRQEPKRGAKTLLKALPSGDRFFAFFKKKVDQTPLEPLRGTFWNLAHPHRIALSGNRRWSRVKLPILLDFCAVKRLQGLAHFNIHSNHQVSWPLSIKAHSPN